MEIPTPPEAEPQPETPPPPTPPWLAAFLADLDQAFAAGVSQAQSRFEDAATAILSQTDKVCQDLAGCRKKLEAAFDQAAAADLNAAAITQLASVIDGQQTWIFRKVRGGIEHEIRQLAPRRRPLAAQLEQMAADIARTVERLPGEVTAVTEAVAGPPPTTAAERLERLLERLLQSPLVRRLRISPRNLMAELIPDRDELTAQPLAEGHAEIHAAALSNLADIWRGLHFHFDVVVDDLEQAQQRDQAAKAEQAAEMDQLAATVVESRRTLLAALEEAEGKLTDLMHPLAHYYQRLPEELQELQQGQRARLLRELEGTQQWRQLLHFHGRRLLRYGEELKERGQKLLSQGKEEMSRSTNTGLAQTGSLLRNVQAFLGRSAGGEATLLAITDLPTRETVLQQAQALPPLYQRLFTLGPLRNREFLVARETELDTLDEVFKRWQEGKACSVALVGPEGSGKTSLLNCFESEFGARGEMLRGELDRRLCREQEMLAWFEQWLQPSTSFDTAAAVSTHLLAEPRRILLIEGGHYLGLRAIGGYQAIRTFHTILMATRRHCLWLVTFRKYPWMRLDYQTGLSQYYTHRLHTLFASQREVREVIQLRQRTTGVPLVFLGRAAPEAPEEEQSLLEQRFFRDLFELTSGDIDAALYFWLRGLTYDPAEKRLRVAPMDKLDHNFLRALGRDYLFILAEVVSHGCLTAAEVGLIFRRSVDDCSLLLDYLTQLNLLTGSPERTDGAGSYGLNPIFYGPVTGVLESMNILY